MSRKQDSKELKMELVRKHIEEGSSYWKLGKEYGIEASIIRRWGYIYDTYGEAGLGKQNAEKIGEYPRVACEQGVTVYELSE